MANSVRISSEHDRMLEELADDVENEMGFRPDKKDIAEKAITEYYNKQSTSNNE